MRGGFSARKGMKGIQSISRKPDSCKWRVSKDNSKAQLVGEGENQWGGKPLWSLQMKVELGVAVEVQDNGEILKAEKD